MKYPNYEGKHAKDSLIEPRQYVEYMRSRGKFPTFQPPQGVILCYQQSLLAHVKENHAIEPCDGFFPNLLFLKETNHKVAIIGGFGIGSPVASVILEELIAFGIKEFISVGTAGTLQKNIHV